MILAFCGGLGVKRDREEVVRGGGLRRGEGCGCGARGGGRIRFF